LSANNARTIAVTVCLDLVMMGQQAARGAPLLAGRYPMRRIAFAT
jgi:hypothetical protein